LEPGQQFEQEQSGCVGDDFEILEDKGENMAVEEILNEFPSKGWLAACFIP